MSEKINKPEQGMGGETIREQIQNVDDETFKKAIIQTALVLGLSEKRAEKLAADVPGLKNKLSHVSDRDVNKLITSLPSEKASEILEMLNKNKKS